MNGDSDERLMERYADDEAAAFGELFARYERRAYALFLARTRSAERAWDLYQDLFLRLHRFRHTYRAGEPFAPWFFQIARRVLVDELRRASASREAPLLEEPEAGSGSGAAERVANLEHAERLLRALSPEQARVVLAAKVEGRGYSEIAERAGKSVAAVKQVASRALRSLRAAQAAGDLGLAELEARERRRRRRGVRAWTTTF